MRSKRIEPPAPVEATGVEGLAHVWGLGGRSVGERQSGLERRFWTGETREATEGAARQGGWGREEVQETATVRTG